MKNVLTIDFEDISYSNLLPEKIRCNDKKRLERSTDILLELLDKYKVKATFFIVGKIAEDFPDIIKKIVKSKHHIGSHSFHHKLIYKINKNVFKDDLKKSISVLEKISDYKIDCFRAPSWSIRRSDYDWFWNVLKENNIKYDSSIFPTKNALFGDPKAPRFINKRKNDILEIPPSTIKYFDRNIPFSGGFYFRFFPYWFIKNSIRKINKKGNPAVIYMHLWEIDSNVERFEGLTSRANFLTYFKINKNLNKFGKLLKDFEFCSIKDFFII